MMAVQPVPVMTTNPNYTGAPMVGYMPPALINGPDNFIYITDPLTELSRSSGAIIRQQIEVYEALTGCETQNRYHVFLQTLDGIKYAFKCSERSDCCARCCCAPDCRPLEIVIRHVVSIEQIQKDYAKIFIRVDKPCKCGCLCFCRPYMEVKLEDNGAILGRVREPCTCCDLDSEIYDPVGNLRYEVVGDCCQVGLCCGPDLEKLASIRFDIMQNGRAVGSIKKLGSSFWEFFTKADSYQINFPQNATPEEKMLLIIDGLMIDYQYFENDEQPQPVGPPPYPYYY